MQVNGLTVGWTGRSAAKVKFTETKTIPPKPINARMMQSPAMSPHATVAANGCDGLSCLPLRQRGPCAASACSICALKPPSQRAAGRTLPETKYLEAAC